MIANDRNAAPSRNQRVLGISAHLARWRVTLGFVFGALVFGLARPTARSVALGFLVAAVGEALRIWAAGHLEKNQGVTVSGPYAWVRHPLYVGSIVMGIGIALASARPMVGALVALYFVLTFPIAIRIEEINLRMRYGDEYGRYADGPRLETTRRFKMDRFWRNREHRAVVGLVVALACFALKASFW